MIAHVSGELTRVGPDYMVIDVGGVGYKVFAPLSVIGEMPQPGSPVRLLTYTHVKEDTLALYGFIEETQEEIFELLIGISGIGPKLALSILSVLPVEKLVDAILREDLHALHGIPGVGNKTAQRIMLELKGKAALQELAMKTKPFEAASEMALDVIEGLVALGYSRVDAKTAAEKASQSVKDKSDTGAVFRAALNELTQGK